MRQEQRPGRRLAPSDANERPSQQHPTSSRAGLENEPSGRPLASAVRTQHQTGPYSQATDMDLFDCGRPNGCIGLSGSHGETRAGALQPSDGRTGRVRGRRAAVLAKNASSTAASACSNDAPTAAPTTGPTSAVAPTPATPPTARDAALRPRRRSTGGSRLSRLAKLIFSAQWSASRLRSPKGRTTRRRTSRLNRNAFHASCWLKPSRSPSVESRRAAGASSARRREPCVDLGEPEQQPGAVLAKRRDAPIERRRARPARPRGRPAGRRPDHQEKRTCGRQGARPGGVRHGPVCNPFATGA